MEIGIIVFAYNRSQHLRKVLDGLRESKEVSKLYIFQDGLKCEEHKNEWEKTRQVIKKINWCEVTYKLSSYNKGLAESIIDGINTVFEQNDAVVILEDDCVPTANFINFMQQCFEKYKDDTRVYSVSGYAWPIDLPKDKYDIYGCGRISSWGWGTWKDRWEKYSTDNDILKRIKADKEKSRYLAAWGSDCEQMLLDRVAGRNDSWAVYWALVVIENRGICINPYKSLINNIGLDGTGVHCGVTNCLEVQLDDSMKKELDFPYKLDILHITELAFVDLYGNYTAASVRDKEKEDVIIYGLGEFLRENEKEINDKYNIIAFIDQRKKGWYAGKNILNISDVKYYRYDKIIVMVKSIQECVQITKEFIRNDID
ncbi:MAG: glycosyltransferase, partial [Lachnospiraceae bacterium]|nr:glycosyltransferase [Lachnospiraceae bacterium]